MYIVLARASQYGADCPVNISPSRLSVRIHRSPLELAMARPGWAARFGGGKRGGRGHRPCKGRPLLEIWRAAARAISPCCRRARKIAIAFRLRAVGRRLGGRRFRPARLKSRATNRPTNIFGQGPSFGSVSATMAWRWRTDRWIADVLDCRAIAPTRRAPCPVARRPPHLPTHTRPDRRRGDTAMQTTRCARQALSCPPREVWRPWGPRACANRR